MAYTFTRHTDGLGHLAYANDVNELQVAIETISAGAVNVKEYGAVGDGTTDDTTAINNAITAGGGKAVYFPVPASYYKISSELVVATANTRLYGHGINTVIKQTVANKGVFDVQADGCTVEGFWLENTATKALIGGSFRGGAAYLESTAVYTYANNLTVRNIVAKNFTCGVFPSSYAPGTGVYGTQHTDHVIDNVFVQGCDFGVLLGDTNRAYLGRIYGTYALTPTSANPPHLVYVSTTTNSNDVRCVDIFGWSSSGGHVLQFFGGVTNSSITNLRGDTCTGVLSLNGVTDVNVNGVVSANDQDNGNGVVYCQSTADARIQISGVEIENTVGATQWVRFAGTDGTLRGVKLKAAFAGANISALIEVYGTRQTVEDVELINAAAGFTNLLDLGDGHGHVARNIRGRGIRQGVTVASGITDCLVEVDPAALRPANMVNTFTFGGTVTGGTFTVTWAPNGSSTSAAINWNDSTATIATKIGAMATVGGASNVVVTGGPAPANFVVSLVGDWEGIDAAAMTVTSSLTGTAPTLAVTKTAATGTVYAPVMPSEPTTRVVVQPRRRTRAVVGGAIRANVAAASVAYQIVDATQAVLWDLTLTDATAPIIVAPNTAAPGQELLFCLNNQSGGAVAAPSWNAAYSLASTVTMPATGKRIFVRFCYDGTTWHEMWRSTGGS